MRVVVTGAAGFVGRRLADELRTRGRLDGRPIDELVLVDRAFAQPPSPTAPIAIRHLTGDLGDASFARNLFAQPVDALFHLAATLTAEAERDFDQGLAVNLEGFVRLLEDCRRQGGLRLVFSSSMAAFGGVLPAMVPDEFPQRPTTSYGVQKVIAELLLDDYTRRGFLDGRALRLPVVLLRPKGSTALSEYISAIVRDPLDGESVVCPFSPATRMPVASVGAVARGLIALYEMPSAALGAVRTVNLPSLSVTVEEMVAALARRSGPAARQLIEWRGNPTMQAMLDAMPQGFTSARAERAGIHAEADFDAVIGDYLAHR